MILTFKTFLLFARNIAAITFSVFTVVVNKKDIKILTELLDLKDVQVISHRLHTGIGMFFQTESKKTYSICPNCGTRSSKLHQNHGHIIKD